MKGKPIQNLAASVFARLLKRTEPGDEQFQFVLMRYGAERLMYRLSQSEHAANFVLKGAMMFLVWTGAPYRATKDMDLLALKSASVEQLQDIFPAPRLAVYPRETVVAELAAAKARGVRLGRPSTINGRAVEIRKLKARGLGLRAIARELKMPPSSVHKALHLAA